IKATRGWDTCGASAAWQCQIRTHVHRYTPLWATAGGTGGRHRVQKWPISSLTGRQHKLVVPAESPDKKFVLLVGASHLRSIVDGFVKMPGGRFSFGAMCTPGACATQLRTEAANAVLPRTPDAVCVMAPSNNLTSSRTITEAGVDFGKLLATAMSRWPNVFALDFVPRLTVDPDYQDMMRQEFRRVAARMGVKYTPIAEYFPVKDLDLWSRDGPNRRHLLCVHRRSPPARRVTPRVIVKGEVAKSPQPDPSKWTVIGQGRKRSQHDEPEQSIDALKPAGTVQQEELEESYFPLTPVWFSSAMLVEMDKISPSHLPGPDEKQFEIAGVRVTHIGPIESSNLSLGPRVTPKTTGTDLGCSSAIQSTLGCTNIQMGAKRKIRKGSSACKKVKKSDVTAVDSDVAFVKEVKWTTAV
ncbi:hypothetical protein KUCAC02_002452, partial [Chaenocephalus aceratus]